MGGSTPRLETTSLVQRSVEISKHGTSSLTNRSESGKAALQTAMLTAFNKHAHRFHQLADKPDFAQLFENGRMGRGYMTLMHQLDNGLNLHRKALVEPDGDE